MLGFLFKILIVVVLVVGVLTYFGFKTGNLSLATLPHDLASFNVKSLFSGQNFDSIKAQLTGVNKEQLSENLSSSLDSLVTHASKNSPVVLGVKVTNESVGAVTDALMGLPSDKLDQIKNALCATPSAE